MRNNWVFDVEDDVNIYHNSTIKGKYERKVFNKKTKKTTYYLRGSSRTGNRDEYVNGVKKEFRFNFNR
jgi:hypothetical protein